MGYFDPLPIFKNFIEVRLREAVDSSDTTIRITGIEEFPAVIERKDFIPCVICNASRSVHEVVYVTAVDVGGGKITVERGQEGTSPRKWPVSTTYLYHAFTANTVQRLRTGGFAPVLDGDGKRPSIRKLSANTLRLDGEHTEIETGIAVRLMRRGGVYVVPGNEYAGIYAIEVSIDGGKTTLEIINATVPEDIVGIDIGIYKAALPASLGDNILVLAAGSTTYRTLGERFADIVNVKDFGAKGDGVTDDSASIRAALAAGSGRTVFAPAGTYKCASPIFIYSNTRFIGDKGTVIRRCFNQVGGESVLLSAKPIAGENHIHDIAIKGIVFDGNGGNYGAVSFDLTYFSSLPTINLSIEDCEFLDVVDFHAIDLNLCNLVHISRCRFKGWDLRYNPDDGTRTQREAIQFDIYNDTSDGYRDKRILVEQCYFGASEHFGPWASGIGNHGFGESGPTTYFTDIVLRNNIFESPSYYGIHCYVFNGAVIEGNVCTGGRFCYIENRYTNSASIYHSSNIVVQNNKCEGLLADQSYSSTGIQIRTWKPEDLVWDEEDYPLAGSENIIIRGNLLRHYTKGIAVRVAGVKGIIISENIMEHCGDDVYYGNTVYLIPVVNEVKITNNIFRNSGTIFTNAPADIAPGYDPESEQEDVWGGDIDYDWASSLTISGNSFVNPSNLTRVLALEGKVRGVIYKDNVIDDRKDNRDVNSAYVLVTADVVGGVMRDNQIFTKAEMTDFYQIGSGGSSIVLDNNQNFINDEFYSNVGGVYA